ncbi:MAG: carbohydrate ABC transporter permease, partial [Armatimonadetes bacterium]|nr:carbohydrate ABC transporter permease [Armatimonadota bacterium]
MRKPFLYLILFAMAVFTTFPFLWTLIVSLKTRGPIFAIP